MWPVQARTDTSIRDGGSELERARSVLDLIRRRASEHPVAPALEMGSEMLSFEGLVEAFSTIAERLRARGIGPGSRVAILSHNHVSAVVATLGILEAGATWIPLNPRNSILDNLKALERLRADRMLFQATFAVELHEKLHEAKLPIETESLDELWRDVPSGGSGRPGRRGTIADLTDPAGIAAIFQTGGTTGEPKGVAFTHKTLLSVIEGLRDVVDSTNLRYLAAGPLTHASGRICLGVLAMGGTTVVLERFDPTAVLKAIESRHISFTNVTPTMLYMLLDEPTIRSHDYSSLTHLAVGAAPLSIERLKEAIEVFGPVIAQGYGQTEAPLLIAHMPSTGYFDDGVFAPDERLASCGTSTAASEVRILGAGNAPVPPSTPGEIAVRGDFVMDGYLNDAGILTSPRDKRDFLLTGDLGVMDAEGYLTILGRSSEMIISGGFNVYPSEVESAIMELDAVRECAVFGTPDEKWGEVVVAAVELHVGSVSSTEDIMKFARERLGGVKAPKRVFVLDELPRSPAGKVLKSALATSLVG